MMIKNMLPMWVWEIFILLGYIGLFLLGALVTVVVIGEDDE